MPSQLPRRRSPVAVRAAPHASAAALASLARLVSIFTSVELPSAAGCLFAAVLFVFGSSCGVFQFAPRPVIRACNAPACPQASPCRLPCVLCSAPRQCGWSLHSIGHPRSCPCVSTGADAAVPPPRVHREGRPRRLAHASRLPLAMVQVAGSNARTRDGAPRRPAR